MREAFSDDEIVMLLDHPGFDRFTGDFREQIWVSVGTIFEERIRDK